MPDQTSPVNQELVADTLCFGLSVLLLNGKSLSPTLEATLGWDASCLSITCLRVNKRGRRVRDTIKLVVNREVGAVVSTSYLVDSLVLTHLRFRQFCNNPSLPFIAVDVPDLKPYIHLKSQLFHPGERFIDTFPHEICLPTSVGKPGLHGRVTIVLKAMPDASSKEYRAFCFMCQDLSTTGALRLT